MSDTTLATLKKVALWALLLLLVWPTQYFFVVPAVYLWRWTVALLWGAMRIGVLGLLLLFIPIIGWAVLAWMVFFRKADTAPKAPRADVLTPWLLGMVRHG